MGHTPGLLGMLVLRTQTTFWSNVNTYGYASGAALSVLADCTVTLTGLSVFEDNAVSSNGGAVFIQNGGSVIVKGPVCAQNNSAGNSGNFASVNAGGTGGTLVFDGPPGSANINSPISGGGDIGLYDSRSVVRCGANGSNWAGPSTPTNYFITGDVCGCNAEFANGSTTSCNTCGAAGWDSFACTCAVSRTAPAIEGGGESPGSTRECV